MKKFFLVPLMAMFAVVAMAQVDFQLHYDLGRTINSESESNRPNLTSTVEMFHPDATGSTYFFIDMDYFSDGVGAAYWEVSREFTFANLKSSNFAAHIEYDGGLSVNKYTPMYASRYQQCILVGPAYNWHNANFAKTFSVQAMYKQYFSNSTCKAIASFQLTGVWSTTFAKGLCTFSGFADLWYGYTPRYGADGQKKGLVFITEPQFWFNIINKDKQHGKFSVGTEWELSNDFIYPTNSSKTFFFNPTVAVKYQF